MIFRLIPQIFSNSINKIRRYNYILYCHNLRYKYVFKKSLVRDAHVLNNNSEAGDTEPAYVLKFWLILSSISTLATILNLDLINLASISHCASANICNKSLQPLDTTNKCNLIKIVTKVTQKNISNHTESEEAIRENKKALRKYRINNSTEDLMKLKKKTSAIY